MFSRLLPPLALEEISPADLVDPARKVRRQEAAHIREVAASIAALGFCDPVLIGSGNTILDGVICVEAAETIGFFPNSLHSSPASYQRRATPLTPCLQPAGGKGFITRSRKNLAPSHVSIHRPRMSFVPSGVTPSAT